MFRYLTSLLILLFVSACKAQTSEKRVLRFAETYSALNSESKTVEFDNESKKFSFRSYTEEGNDVKYDLLLNDVHPLGVFLLKKTELEYTIRILSIDNGKRFIRERVVNDLRLSNNINYVDLFIKSSKEESEVRNFIKELILFIEENSREENRSIPIQTIQLPKNKKGK